MTFLFNATLTAGAACIACLGLIGINNVNRAVEAYEVDASERAAYLCDLGSDYACAELVALTDGLCAGPDGSGCQFSSEVAQ